MLRCVQCGEPLTAADRGRRPRYCSRACQARAYRARTAARTSGRAPRAAESGLSRERIVRAAIAIADREGLDALSMRRVATELDAGVMSLYRYVPGKDELIDLMVEAVLGEEEADPSTSDDWRAELERFAWTYWRMCRRHQWVLRTLSLTRPRMAPRGMAYTDRALRALHDAGVDLGTATAILLTVGGYTQGVALMLVNETEAERDSGLTPEQWWTSRNPELMAHVASGRYPMLARIAAEDDSGLANLDAEFEFGLRCVLDGIATRLNRR